jgi:hypothetical protein
MHGGKKEGREEQMKEERERTKITPLSSLKDGLLDAVSFVSHVHLRVFLLFVKIVGDLV